MKYESYLSYLSTASHPQFCSTCCQGMGSHVSVLRLHGGPVGVTGVL